MSNLWIEAAESYLNECVRAAASPRASELAAKLNISPVRLAREFRGQVGGTVSSFLKTRQVEHAKALLLRTSFGTEEIARLAGFGTARTFYRSFLKYTGMTPTDWRDAARRSSVS